MPDERGHEDIDTAALKRSIDTLAVFSQHVELKKRGAEYLALCPFHDEQTPSFTVFEKSGEWRYHWFGCGADGDVIAFVQAVLGCEFPAAAEYLGANRDVPRAITAGEARLKALQNEERDLADALTRLRGIVETAPMTHTAGGGVGV